MTETLLLLLLLLLLLPRLRLRSPRTVGQMHGPVCVQQKGDLHSPSQCFLLHPHLRPALDQRSPRRQPQRQRILPWQSPWPQKLRRRPVRLPRRSRRQFQRWAVVAPTMTFLWQNQILRLHLPRFLRPPPPAPSPHPPLQPPRPCLQPQLLHLCPALRSSLFLRVDVLHVWLWQVDPRTEGPPCHLRRQCTLLRPIRWELS